MEKQNPEIGDRYLHKGRSYEVVGVATETESGEQLVVYSPINKQGGIDRNTLFARPLKMFIENIEIEVDGKETPRFKFIPRS